MTEREALVVLNAIPGVGNRTILHLLEHFQSAKGVLQTKLDDLLALGIQQNVALNLINFKTEQWLCDEFQKLEDIEGSIITMFDKEYPEELKNISDAPVVIYILGKIPTTIRKSIAIVGSRRCSIYGMKTAEKFGRELSEYGIHVISGMARGIDTAAHRGALRTECPTIAVLGCGVDLIYPPENKNLKWEIINQGAVISEFPLGTKPLPYNFPRRNRIVSGLTLGTLVVEAAQKSGALITAEFALEQGKDVFAIPGNIDSPVSKGVLDIIRDGAQIATHVEDLLSSLALELNLAVHESEPSSSNEKIGKELNEIEYLLLNQLNFEPLHIDQIAKICNTSNSLAVSTLLSLEFKGLVQQEPGMFYKKRHA